MEHEHLYNNQAKAEKYIIGLCDEMEGDQDALIEASQFYMRRGEAYAEKAEAFLKDAYSFGMGNLDVAWTYACLLVQNKQFSEALVILQSLAKEKHEVAKVYMIMSLSYKHQGEELLAAKYKAMAFIEQMRSKEVIRKPGNLNGTPPDGRLIEAKPAPEPVEGEEQAVPEKTNEVESSPAFGNRRLTSEEENDFYLELGETLLEKSLCVLSNECLDLIEANSN